MTMKKLVLDPEGEISMILNAEASDEGAIDFDVPEDYPEWMKWDATTQQFLVDNPKIDTALHNRVDEEFAAVVRTIISDLPSQTRRYEQKYAEANAYLAAGENPIPTDYPFLYAESQASEMPIASLVAEVKALGDSWASMDIALEAARMSAKRAITKAVGKEMKELAAIVDWAQILELSS